MTTLPVPSVSRKAAPTPRPVWFGPKMSFARWGLVVNLLVPLVLLAWDARRHSLGVDAVNFATHTTGFVAIIYLALSLLVTPVRQVTGWSWLVQFRRSLGVYAFYYAAAHLAVYFWWNQGRDVRGTVYEITHRYYLMIGFASLAVMAPLWATSFDAAVRWMGGTKWKWLHRLTYVAVVLAGVHYYLQSKSYKRNPQIYLAVVGGLLLWRGVAAVVTRVRRPARAAKSATPARKASLAGKSAGRPAGGGKAASWKGDLKVVGMFRETPGVRTFRLAVPDGGPVPFAYAAGQFLNLSITIDGKPAGRSYTIASPPTRDGYLELTVKREPGGHVSPYLHDMLMTGQTVAVSAPVGRFTFDPAGEDGVLLVAGGVGVTPVMAILRDLTDRCWAGKIDLVFSVKAPGDVIFAAELDYLTARHPNLRVHLTYTRNAPDGWEGARGRVTAGLLRERVPDFAARHAFVCGPDAMARAVYDELRSAGVIEKRITRESFTPAAAAAPPAPDATPAGPVDPTERPDADADADIDTDAGVTVTFAGSDKAAPLSAGQTVLEAAEAAGVRIDYQCRSGVCGTCRCRLLDGHVTMPVRDALSEADEADGYILACQAHADGDVTVDA